MTVAKAKAKLDKIFSQFIRLRAVNDEGWGECFTCGRLRHYKSADAGHFMVRQKMPTRFHELNVQFQCKACNGFEGGAQYEFAKRLDELHGEGTADRLVRLSNETKRFSVHELEDLCKIYKKKVDELRKSKGLE